jgi:hypothetical protein
MVASFSLVADAASDGKHVILGMLIVGLVFIGVIAVGQFFKWMGHRHAQH